MAHGYNCVNGIYHFYPAIYYDPVDVFNPDRLLAGGQARGYAGQTSAFRRELGVVDVAAGGGCLGSAVVDRRAARRLADRPGRTDGISGDRNCAGRGMDRPANTDYAAPAAHAQQQRGAGLAERNARR